MLCGWAEVMGQNAPYTVDIPNDIVAGSPFQVTVTRTSSTAPLRVYFALDEGKDVYPMEVSKAVLADESDGIWYVELSGNPAQATFTVIIKEFYHGNVLEFAAGTPDNWAYEFESSPFDVKPGTLDHYKVFVPTEEPVIAAPVVFEPLAAGWELWADDAGEWPETVDDPGSQRPKVLKLEVSDAGEGEAGIGRLAQPGMIGIQADVDPKQESDGTTGICMTGLLINFRHGITAYLRIHDPIGNPQPAADVVIGEDWDNCWSVGFGPVDPDSYHNLKIMVREGKIQFFVNGNHFASYPDEGGGIFEPISLAVETRCEGGSGPFITYVDNVSTLSEGAARAWEPDVWEGVVVAQFDAYGNLIIPATTDGDIAVSLAVADPQARNNDGGALAVTIPAHATSGAIDLVLSQVANAQQITVSKDTISGQSTTFPVIAPGTVTHTVIFDMGKHGTPTGVIALRQVVPHGGSATEPGVQADDGWTFTGWDTGFANVTADVTVTAQYQASSSEHLYVDDSATGDNSGASWPHAFVDLQSAVDAASPGDTIHIAAGTYFPTARPYDTDDWPAEGEDPRSPHFGLRNGVTILGGYPNGGGAPEQRDPAAHKVVLSGDLDGNGVVDGGNAYHVFYHPAGAELDATAVLDGVTISGGNADVVSAHTNIGGGMYNRHSHPTLRNCTFTDNHSSLWAGSMYNESSHPTLTDCSFRDNRSGVGGAVYNIYASPAMVGCVFADNYAEEVGGAMANLTASPTLDDCTFTGNSGRHGGGVLNANASFPVFTNCTFRNNVARVHSGGAMETDNASPTLDSCTFTGNAADSGGAIYCDGSSVTLIDCTFADNTARGAPGAGMCSSNSVLDLTRCTFTTNNATGESGGAMYNEECSGALTDCTFAGNTAWAGAAIYNVLSSPTISGCTLSDNVAEWGGAIYNDSSSPTLDACEFLRNTAGDGGATYNADSSPTLNDCSFADNAARSCGGAIFMKRSSPKLTRCSFTENTAENYDGGGICAEEGTSVSLAQCSFTRNVTGRRGGGVMLRNSSVNASESMLTGNAAGSNGGAVALLGMGTTATLTNCQVSSNSAIQDGGGLYCWDSPSVLLRDCRLEDNSAGSIGGAVEISDNVSASLINCILAGNTADDRGDGVDVMHSSTAALTNCTFWDHGTVISYDYGTGNVINLSNCILWDQDTAIMDDGVDAVVTVTYSAVQNGYAGAGNIAVYPVFADPANGDFHLLPGSPCIDAGNNAAAELPATDMAGNSRRLDDTGIPDSGSGTAPIVDMGAYEFVGSSTHTVTFHIDDRAAHVGGGDLTQTVIHGHGATAPTLQTDAGWIFDGWDAEFATVTSDLDVHARLVLVTHLVTFDAGEHGTRIGGGSLSQTVGYGSSAVAPIVQSDFGWTFIGWDENFLGVTSDLVVNAQYSPTTYTLEFAAGQHGSLDRPDMQTVVHGSDSMPVTALPDTGYRFAGWMDGSVDNPRVVSSVTGSALYIAVFAPEDGPSILSARVEASHDDDTPELRITTSGWQDPAAAGPEGYVYEWQRNGETIEGHNSAVLPQSLYGAGDTITCSVTAWNGIREGNTIKTDPVVVYRLSQGWNLISLPVYPFETDPAMLLVNPLTGRPCYIGSVWGRDGHRYKAINCLVPGHGYWVYCRDEGMPLLFVEGLPVSVSDHEIQLGAGWGLYGPVGEKKYVTILAPVWGWILERADYFFPENGRVQKCFGYWFYAAPGGRRISIATESN